MKGATVNDKTVKVKIKRRNKPDAKPYWQEFAIPYKEHLNVIACLQDIQRNPTTQSGEWIQIFLNTWWEVWKVRWKACH